MNSFYGVRGLVLLGTLFGFLFWVSCASTGVNFRGEKRGSAAESMGDDEIAARLKLKQEIEDEVVLGREISAKLLGTFELYSDNKAASEYVNRVGQSLARQSGRPELVYRFAILKSEEPNAYAAPGGYVFITRGLLRLIQNESELACVLGHEIAHINEKHMYNEIVPKRENSTTETLARLLSRGRSDLGSSISKMVNQGLTLLLSSGLGAEKESAADEAGVVYASTAGYSSYAMISVLERMKVHVDQSTSTLSKTHPPFPARLASLKGFLAENQLPKKSIGNEEVMQERFLNAKFRE